MVSTNYKHRFFLVQRAVSQDFLDLTLKAFFLDGGGRIGSDNLTNFLVFSLNVSGDGIGCSSQLS